MNSKSIIVILLIVAGLGYLVLQRRQIAPYVVSQRPEFGRPAASLKEKNHNVLLPHPSGETAQPAVPPKPQEAPPKMEISQYLEGMETKLVPSMKKYEDQFSSKANAEKALDDLVSCLTMAKSFTAANLRANPKNKWNDETTKMTEEMPDKIQANCLWTGAKLVEKYPSLQGAFHSKLLSKASPRAREILKDLQARKYN